MKVIEFLGMPRAGKTTGIEVMESYFKKEGARVRIVYEGARVCPLDKQDRFMYNSWSFHNTVNRILEARLDHYDFILVDRGVLDHYAFSKAIEPDIKPFEWKNPLAVRDYYRQFLQLQDLEILFMASPEEAIRRETKDKPFAGRVFQTDFLNRLEKSYLDVENACAHWMRKLVKIEANGSLKENVDRVLEMSQGMLEEMKGGDKDD